MNDRERDLDASLRGALRIEPDAVFLARVRDRLRDETPAPGFARLPAALLSAAALGLVLLFALWPEPGTAVAPARAAQPAAPQTAVEPSRGAAPESLAVAATPSRGLPSAPRRKAPADDPRPLVPPGQAAAVAQLALGRAGLSPEGDLARALAEWPVATELSELRIEPLSIEPLTRSGT